MEIVISEIVISIQDRWSTNTSSDTGTDCNISEERRGVIIHEVSNSYDEFAYDGRSA